DSRLREFIFGLRPKPSLHLFGAPVPLRFDQVFTADNSTESILMADFKVTELDPALDFNTLPWWDVVIIGAGPAGLAASLTTAHRGLTTLVIEAKSEPGGQPQFLYADKKIVDIPGFPDGISGEELSQRTYRQA